MGVLIFFSIALFMLTNLLLFLNWRILIVTEKLLSETIKIRKDTQIMKGDTKRVADSFDVQVPVPDLRQSKRWIDKY